MKKTKNLLSIFLVLLITTLSLFGTAINANANVIEEPLDFAVYQYGHLDYDYYGKSKAFYNFSITSYTTLKIEYESNEGFWNKSTIEIIKESDYHNYTIGRDVNKYISARCEGNNDYEWLTKNVSLSAGSYYLVIDCGQGPGGESQERDYSLSVTPTVNKIKNLKSTTSSNSVKLSWTADKGAIGYQVQKSTSDGYKTVKTITGTSCTFKDLSSAYAYKYRVRGYTKLEGKTYYGYWSNITAITKPNKVSIKTPSTNSKHQIIAKWNKVTRATGYQVQYCKNKSCSSVIATKTVSGQSKISYTGKNFTKNKTYYIRVRAYKTVNNKKYYGAWSSVKSIKCK